MKDKRKYIKEALESLRSATSILDEPNEDLELAQAKAAGNQALQAASVLFRLVGALEAEFPQPPAKEKK